MLLKAMAEKKEADARKEKAKKLEKLEKAKRQLAVLKKSIRQDPNSAAKLEEMKAIRERSDRLCKTLNRCTCLHFLQDMEFGQCERWATKEKKCHLKILIYHVCTDITSLWKWTIPNKTLASFGA